MSARPVITLTTDFGHKDAFAGVMKGVILSINPDAQVIDLTHGIGPQDIVGAAYVLGMSCRYFPPRTIHVAVVDPGVGSARRPIAAFDGDHFFVGPDNGVFTAVFSGKSPRIVDITERRFVLSDASPTFQGRDLFAPAAAWLSRGVDIAEFGTPVLDYVRVGLRAKIVADRAIEGEVILIDNFGNAITNITEIEIAGFFPASGGGDLKVYFRGEEIAMKRFYSQAQPGKLHALINSSRHLELFVNLGSASSEYGIKRGEKVELKIERE